MKEQEGKRSKILEVLKNVNKLTLVGFLGFAVVAAVVAPELVVPALSLAAIDAGQVIVIDKINKKKSNPKEQVVYQAGAA
jgi:hypothetical protein